MFLARESGEGILRLGDRGIEMRCMYCGGEMKRTRSTYTIDRDGYHLFIKDVPVYICTKCGEKHFEEDEVAAIQQLIRAVEEGIEKVRTGS
jgi:YgiT-type zinc finger domain-containing protein